MENNNCKYLLEQMQFEELEEVIAPASADFWKGVAVGAGVAGLVVLT
ncbi:daptide-type RiPP [Priestia endophytica]|nr:hypothetical protein [Priestia endophytica]